MPISYTYPYIQYGGIWTTSQATDAVAAGTWAVPPTPKLFAWGLNSFGELGTGNQTSYSSPKQIGALTNWLYLAGGGDSSGGSSLATKTDGTLWAWGNNDSGQLGNGNTTSVSSPNQIGTLTNWLYIACGYKHTTAVKTDGTLWAWGKNNLGQLGLGNTTYYSSPKQIGTLTTWSFIASGGDSNAAIKTDGTLWTWGKNNNGQLAQGNTTALSSPKQVGSLTNWSKIICSPQFQIAIKTDGTLWSWGRNNAGQLGLNNQSYYSSPKQIGLLTNWVSVCVDGYGSCSSVKTDGTLWSWGANNRGQLGLGNRTYYSSPKQIGALTNWLYVSGQYYGRTSIKTNGTLWAWGNNAYGELGLGNKTYYSSPKQVGSLTSWTTVQVSSSVNKALAIAKT